MPESSYMTTAWREPIFNALFNKVSNASFLTPDGHTGFVTKQRRYIKPDLVNKEDMPALFMVGMKEMDWGVKQLHGMPIKRNMMIELHIIVHSSNGEFPDSIMNAVLDGLEESIKPLPASKQTLGGLVEWCYIDSSGIKRFNNVKGDAQVAIVPINLFRMY